MKKISIIVVAIAILAGVWLLLGNREARDEISDVARNTENAGEKETEKAPTVFNGEEGDVKVFEIEASNFKFSVGEMRVQKGDKVRVVLSGMEGLHDFVLEGHDAATERVQAGEMAMVEFIADKEGEFEYYCSVGSHRQMGMTGSLIVE